MARRGSGRRGTGSPTHVTGTTSKTRGPGESLWTRPNTEGPLQQGAMSPPNAFGHEGEGAAGALSTEDRLEHAPGPSESHVPLAPRAGGRAWSGVRGSGFESPGASRRRGTGVRRRNPAPDHSWCSRRAVGVGRASGRGGRRRHAARGATLRSSSRAGASRLRSGRAGAAVS